MGTGDEVVQKASGTGLDQPLDFANNGASYYYKERKVKLKMGYRLKETESVPDAIKRIALEQVDRALDRLSLRTRNRDRAFEARVCFKKIRAVLRLVYGELGREIFKFENKEYRNAGRHLSWQERVRETHCSLTTTTTSEAQEPIAIARYSLCKALQETSLQGASACPGKFALRSMCFKTAFLTVEVPKLSRAGRF